jgi:hypothetical protein
MFMLARFSNWARRLSTGWVAAIALLIFLVFTATVLPSQASKAEAETGASGSPDMSFFYAADDLYQYAESYGEQGRAAYIRARFTFDVIWPLVYGFFLCAGIGWLFGRAFPAASGWQLANVVPVLGVLLDYLENISTSLVMARYPAATPVVDVLAPIFTMVKWIFVGGSFVLLLVGGVVGLVRWVRASTSK